MTYIPIEINDEYCIVFERNDIVRVYNSVPIVDSTSSFTDYYITDHYTYLSGNAYIDEPVACLSLDNFTNNIFYRYDISDILLSFTCIFFVSILLIYFALKCFFRGLFK